MNNIEILSKIGLSEHESSVYISLVKMGPMTVSGISRETRLHRPSVYKVLPELQEKGFVSVTPKGKRKKYVAEPPRRLRALVENMGSNFDNMLSELEAEYGSSETKPIIKYLEGGSGIKFVFEDLITSLKRGETYYRYTSESEKDKSKANKYLPQDFRKRRDNKDIERLVICNESTFGRKKQKQTLNRSLKMIPAEYDLFDYDVSMFIYDDKVAYIDYNTETAFIVENKTISEFQKKIFRLLYNKL